MRTATETRDPSVSESTIAGGRPVLLATIGVPLDGTATSFALDAAVEGGRSLILANLTRLEPLWLSVRLGYDALEELTPEVAGSMRRAASAALAFGIRVERLRVRSPRPITALLELIAERGAGILVFGPDRAALGIRRYRRSVQRIRDADPCLVWAADSD